MSESVQAAVFVPFESLVPWDRNPRNNEEAIPRVMRSLETFGFGRPLIAWGSTGSRRLVVGHTTFAAYSRLVAKHGEDWHPGGTPAPGMVPVRWRDDWSEEQAAGYAIADNRLGEIATWDEAVLAELLGELKLGDVDLDAVGYSEADLDGLVERPETPGAPEPEDPPDEPVSRVGEVYELGPHRLVCGDCTDSAVAAALFGDERADIILTDPPYCSGGFQESGKAAGSVGTRGSVMIARDTLSTRGYQALMRQVLVVIPVGIVYAFTDWRMWISLFDVAESSGFGVRNMIVWDKGSPGMGVGWRMQHELILVGVRVKSPFDPHKAQGNVIQSKRTGNVNHATEKPVDLLEKIIEVNDFAKVVADPFAGSGTTLLACARTGRSARLIEIDPRYCDVIRRRWTQWATEAGVDPGPGALA